MQNGVGQRFRWDARQRAPTAHLRGFAGIHPLVIQSLWNRGIRDPDDVVAFLSSENAPLHSPWQMRGMAEAVDRLVRARADGESVAVYGDYDVDGICSTVVLTQCLRAVGVRTEWFVPRRDVEGYGLNSKALESLREAGATLVIAVDCGISGEPEIERGRSIGLDVIVVDHHHVPVKLPRAVAVVNPKQPGCDYPFKDLCATGLVFKLVQALFERLEWREETADQWLDLVALGTVADVVPLVGENRSLVQRGLPSLNPPMHAGLAALARRSGVQAGKVNSRTLAFVLAPRLNAVGRLTDARFGVELLLSESHDEADKLADQLEATNRERQQLTNRALSHARGVLAEPNLPKLLLVADEDYPSGVVGLVAARLTEEFCRPSLVAQVGDGLARGSARSIEGFHITEALAQCSDVLTRHGGHARAAGFTVEFARLDELRQRLQLIASEQISDADIQPCLTVDAEISLSRYDATLYQKLLPLEPFGCANPPPVLASSRLQVVNARVVGQGTPGHLKLKLRDKGTIWDAIGFGMGDRLAELGEQVDVVYSVERNEWNGIVSTQLRLRDLRSSVA